MIQKKICLLGGFGVGKTSLVSRFVHSIFSDKYLTTVGVKIEKKSLVLNEQELDLVIWDLYGEDDFQKVRMSYLRGASGYLLVADGTRRTTLDTAMSLHEAAVRTILHESPGAFDPKVVQAFASCQDRFQRIFLSVAN